MLSINNVTKKYGSFTALKEINLELENGVYGLLAPNGAGKTTLLNMIATLSFPTHGEITWDGIDILALDEKYGDILGFLPQQFGYYKNYCIKCHKEYTAEFVFHNEGIPRCECGGLIKPAVVLYGEMLPDDFIKAKERGSKAFRSKS